MGLQTFSMCMNMRCINHSAYDKQIKLIINLTRAYTEQSLKKARVEVEKAFSELEGTLELKKTNKHCSELGWFVAEERFFLKIWHMLCY